MLYLGLRKVSDIKEHRQGQYNNDINKISKENSFDVIIYSFTSISSPLTVRNQNVFETI